MSLLSPLMLVLRPWSDFLGSMPKAVLMRSRDGSVRAHLRNPLWGVRAKGVWLARTQSWFLAPEGRRDHGLLERRYSSVMVFRVIRKKQNWTDEISDENDCRCRAEESENHAPQPVGEAR